MAFTVTQSSPDTHATPPVPQFLLLSSPPNLLRDDFRCRFVFSDEEAFEGIIVVNGHGGDDVAAIVHRSNHFLLPIANLSDEAIPFADYNGQGGSRGRLEDAVDALVRICESVRQLPESIRFSDEPEAILLARIHTRDGILAPAYDASVGRLVSYPAAGLIDEPWRHADRLAEAGFLSKHFFDRFQCCPSCGSSRLNVREECSACRSADLFDETTIHHFRCAHQAIERQFRQGEKLVCPKCSRELRHFGVDYDKPGLMTACRNCGHVDEDSLVGFVCIDCGSRHDGQAVATRDWYEYKMTGAGERSLLSGQVTSRKDGQKNALDTFRLMVSQGLRLNSRYDKPLTILKIAFTRTNQVRKQHGERVLAQARAHALDIVRGELRDTDLVLDTEDNILVYMPETDTRQTETPHRRLIDRIHSTLRVDLGAEVSLVDAEELSSLLPTQP
jgi:hypothetical protein